MAATKRKKKTPKGSSRRAASTRRVAQDCDYKYCTQPVVEPPNFSPQVNDHRRALIVLSNRKWANGTHLNYFFFRNREWRGTDAEQDVVREAFSTWKNLKLGLEFDEVDSVDEAEIRIGFQRGDGTWSYVGRDVLDQGQTDRTMNFGWNVRDDSDTALHEIGHTLGFPHEHQNPNAGIEWNEEAVYADLAGAPNFWSREKTHWNIIRKLPQSDVDGSDWDKNSIMHYAFKAGMIVTPEGYETRPLIPAPGLSARDKSWARKFYPPLGNDDYALLKPFVSVPAKLEPGEQLNFYVKPTASRDYSFATFGESDTVMVLFEQVDGVPRYLVGDDDSGEQFNAQIEQRLLAGRTYILRVRLYWQNRKGDFGVMMW